MTTEKVDVNVHFNEKASKFLVTVVKVMNQTIQISTYGRNEKGLK